MELNNTNNLQQQFTFFGKGYYSTRAQKWVPSTTPQLTVDIAWTGAYILSERAKFQTEELRRIMPTASDQELRDYKLREFDAVAGAGTFSYGAGKDLLQRSRYIVLDVDDLESTEQARDIQRTLVADIEVETALCFLSPKGLGIKWWVEIPEWCMGLPFAEQYGALSRYVGFHYGVMVDPSGSNVNRLCFLPYDPCCFINCKYLNT